MFSADEDETGAPEPEPEAENAVAEEEVEELNVKGGTLEIGAVDAAADEEPKVGPEAGKLKAFDFGVFSAKFPACLPLSVEPFSELLS